MHFQCVRYVASMAVAGLLVGCSGGDESESAPSAARTFTAEGEARRIAVLYRAIRDTSNVLLPYMRSSAELKAMDGTSVGCLTSGTASRTFNPGPGSGVEESLQIQFSNCGESIGLISGQITVMWNSSADDPANGTFKPTWFGTFTVDGMTRRPPDFE